LYLEKSGSPGCTDLGFLPERDVKKFATYTKANILKSTLEDKVGSDQGDQIGRKIVAQRVIVYFGQFFENYQSSLHFWVNFSHS
jgi:hypothetical protein